MEIYSSGVSRGAQKGGGGGREIGLSSEHWGLFLLN